MAAARRGASASVLQQALTRLLRLDAGRGYLIVALAVEAAGPNEVAAELGLDALRLVGERLPRGAPR
jgi:hypothetical protein